MKNSALTISTLTRQCNELLILTILSEGRTHGYDIARELETKSEGYFSFNHGTLYPILHKLEKDGFIRGSWKQEGPRRKRKYYSLSAQGKKYRESLRSEWDVFFSRLFSVTGGERS